MQQYATRWLIEEFHKVLKTGLGAERLQLERAERIFVAVALMSVVATRLLALREWVRLIPEGDGMPGWLSLWKGMARLQTLVEGVRLAREIKTYG